jgi:hypothetical protein
VIFFFRRSASCQNEKRVAELRQYVLFATYTEYSVAPSAVIPPLANPGTSKL